MPRPALLSALRSLRLQLIVLNLVTNLLFIDSQFLRGQALGDMKEVFSP